jgi:hypothetical protein
LADLLQRDCDLLTKMVVLEVETPVSLCPTLHVAEPVALSRYYAELAQVDAYGLGKRNCKPRTVSSEKPSPESSVSGGPTLPPTVDPNHVEDMSSPHIPCDTRRSRPQVQISIEHRIFSFTIITWRGAPLVFYRTVIELIGATTTTPSPTSRSTRQWFWPRVQMSHSSCNPFVSRSEVFGMKLIVLCADRRLGRRSRRTSNATRPSSRARLAPTHV